MSETGSPSPEQRAWGEAIGESYRLLKPSDWAWIEEVLA